MTNFAAIVRKIRCRHRLRVHKWRKEMSGSAWQVHYRGGRTLRWIESPFPKSPVSLAIFLHEVGHHVIGFDTYRTRCEEEYHVWCWALEEMHRLGIEPDRRVRERFRLSMEYAVDKAMRRGIKRLPPALQPFTSRAA